MKVHIAAVVSGSPDIVLPKHRAVIDVRGCYWHAHGCHLFREPAANSEFWGRKLATNVARDRRNDAAIAEAGWRQLVVWECALKGKGRWGMEHLQQEMISWLRAGDASGELRGADLAD